MTLPTPNVVGIVQARTSSTRLPVKVMRPILGRPMLARQLDRLNRCAALDALIVATSDRSEDDPIADLCDRVEVECFRGSLTDVLDRFYQCASMRKGQHVVRLTGDCPLADPELIDALIRFYLDQGFDYASNCRPPTLPDGLDAEIFSFAALETAWREATHSFEREHVVPYIVRRPERFRIGNLTHERDLSQLRWTVDEAEDFSFVTRVYEALYPAKPDFRFQDVLALLAEHPELTDLNRHFERNEGSRRT